MSVGTIVSLPTQYSAYARIRDEYGQERTVQGSQIPSDLDEGDSFAYTVNIMQYPSDDAVTLSQGYGRR